MKNITKVFTVVIAALGIAAANPAVQAFVAGVVSAHPFLASFGAAASLIGALLHNPSAS